MSDWCANRRLFQIASVNFERDFGLQWTGLRTNTPRGRRGSTVSWVQCRDFSWWCGQDFKTAETIAPMFWKNGQFGQKIGHFGRFWGKIRDKQEERYCEKISMPGIGPLPCVEGVQPLSQRKFWWRSLKFSILSSNSRFCKIWRQDFCWVSVDPSSTDIKSTLPRLCKKMWVEQKSSFHRSSQYARTHKLRQFRIFVAST